MRGFFPDRWRIGSRTLWRNSCAQIAGPLPGSRIGSGGKGCLDLRRSKKEVEQYELTDDRKPILCPKCGRRFMDSAPDTKSRLIIPKKGRYPDYYVKCGHCGAEIGVIKTE